MSMGIELAGGGVPYWRGGGAVHMPRWMQNSTSRWLRACVSSFNNRCLCKDTLWLFVYFHQSEKGQICPKLTANLTSLISTNWDSLFIIPVTSREGIFRYFFLQGQFEKSSKHWWYYVALNLWKSHVVDVIKLFGGNLDSPKSWNSIKFVLMPEPAQKCQNNAILS